ncbi:SRPBCC family protein [Ideonella azotifigens]|uniref:SRPBCC family protein n=1 Tax=Ideonella azotifigens TaxID=513160 RepID=A0ABN1JZS4_9BURK|nr:SRPBCC family protein [Ideonella azotifigens]MCD2342611.1 SRPBCC family protein [Ideonella azotifigens]
MNYLIVVGTVVGLIVGLIALIVIIGMLLPVKHSATRSIVLPTSPARLWELISDFAAYDGWRTGVVEMQRQPDANGHPVWKELEKGGGGLAFETLAVEPQQRIVRRIVGEGLPFGGTWTFVLKTVETGTELTVTEDGEVYNPVFRFVSRFIMGHQRSMRIYFDDLTRKLAVQAVSFS